MFKFINKKLHHNKPVRQCSKCGALESKDYTGDYIHLDRPRGKTFEDGYIEFADGWLCQKCNNYDWLIPNDDEWLATQDYDVVLLDVWDKYNKERIAKENINRKNEILKLETEFSNRFKSVDSAINLFNASINVYSDMYPVTKDELINAGKVLIEELEICKTYTVHLLSKQAIVIGINNQDRALLKSWGHDVKYDVTEK